MNAWCKINKAVKNRHSPGVFAFYLQVCCVNINGWLYINMKQRANFRLKLFSYHQTWRLSSLYYRVFPERILSEGEVSLSALHRLMSRTASSPLSAVFAYIKDNKVKTDDQSFLLILSITLHHRRVSCKLITWTLCKLLLKCIRGLNISCDFHHDDRANPGCRWRRAAPWWETLILAFRTWGLISLFLFIKVSCILGQPWLNHITTNAMYSGRLIPFCSLCVCVCSCACACVWVITWSLYKAWLRCRSSHVPFGPWLAHYILALNETRRHVGLWDVDAQLHIAARSSKAVVTYVCLCLSSAGVAWDARVYI